MDIDSFRTYRRREVTRESGYHTCEETTGSECILSYAKQYICNSSTTLFCFHRKDIKQYELFESGYSIIGFGGYIHSLKNASFILSVSYVNQNGISVHYTESGTLMENSWTNIGIHTNIKNEKSVYISLSISSEINNVLNFIAFDFDTIKKEDFIDNSLQNSFKQKTKLHIPYLYYLDTQLAIDKYLESDQKFERGKLIVLKSCNRCGRYLPINIDNESKTLSFSLHCKKKAPCIHSAFRAYKIENLSEFSQEELKDLNIENDKLISYYGHQLECKACKKFFVNAPLNPQRTPQQFKEDGLRRRALEILINTLLNKNLIHFEFEQRTKKEFSKFIWEKFNRSCFKCGPIEFNEMALDHTMPLAYLYPLDETATCLCSSHNAQKRDRFPVDYYNKEELEKLSEITKIPLNILSKKEVNEKVLKLLIKNIVWFYDDFLMKDEYQKVRDGILTADKINESLNRVLKGKVNLIQEYYKITGHYPKSINIKE